MSAKWLGKRAKCTCGTVVVLGQQPSTNLDASTQLDTASTEPPAPPAMPQIIQAPTPATQQASPTSQKNAARDKQLKFVPKPTRLQQLQQPDVKTPSPKRPTVKPPQPAAPTLSPSVAESWKLPDVISPPQARTRNPGTPDAPVTPITEDLFDDIDHVLASSGDPSPIPPPPPKSVSDNQAAPARPLLNINLETLIFFASLFAGAVSMILGFILVIARWSELQATVVANFCEQLRSAYSGTFGLVNAPESLVPFYLTIGWVLWTVGLLLLLMGAVQVANGFSRLILHQRLFRWADGLVITLGLAAMTCFILLIMTQVTMQKQWLAELGSPEAIGLVNDDVANDGLNRQRTEFVSLARHFRNSMIVGIIWTVLISSLGFVILFCQMRTEEDV